MGCVELSDITDIEEICRVTDHLSDDDLLQLLDDLNEATRELMTASFMGDDYMAAVALRKIDNVWRKYGVTELFDEPVGVVH